LICAPSGAVANAVFNATRKRARPVNHGRQVA
jgi:CO/xanthine dehydrogenase Mo-binding subunit